LDELGGSGHGVKSLPLYLRKSYRQKSLR
jgi:hypothetical protein